MDYSDYPSEEIVMEEGVELKNPGGFKTFKTDVHEFNDIDNEINKVKDQLKPLKELLKELTNSKKLLEQNICSYMGENEVVTCNLPDDGGTLKYQTRKSKAPITQQHVRDEIVKFFTEGKGKEKTFNTLPSGEKATFLIEFIYNSARKQTEKTSLRKIKPKVPKN